MPRIFTAPSLHASAGLSTLPREPVRFACHHVIPLPPLMTCMANLAGLLTAWGRGEGGGGFGSESNVLVLVRFWKPKSQSLYRNRDSRRKLRTADLSHRTRSGNAAQRRWSAQPSNAYFVRGDMLWAGGLGVVCEHAKRGTAAMRRGSWCALTY